LSHSKKFADAEKPPPKAVMKPGVELLPRGQLLTRPWTSLPDQTGIVKAWLP
jgi:hypothetical protein